MEQDKEKLAAVLTKRVERAVKLVKALVVSAGTVAAGLVIFALVAIIAIDDAEKTLIGLAVFIVCIVALLAAVCAVFIYAKINLNSLNKLE